MWFCSCTDFILLCGVFHIHTVTLSGKQFNNHTTYYYRVQPLPGIRNNKLILFFIWIYNSFTQHTNGIICCSTVHKYFQNIHIQIIYKFLNDFNFLCFNLLFMKFQFYKSLMESGPFNVGLADDCKRAGVSRGLINGAQMGDQI